jgi:hypothetical protein
MVYSSRTSSFAAIAASVNSFEGVIPGASETSEPGIHTRDGGYGFSDVQSHIEARDFAASKIQHQ